MLRAHRRCRSLFLALCTLFSPFAAAGLQAETNWNRFRGENGSGIVEHSNVPIPWTAEDTAWTQTLPGKGNGSPCVQSGKVFIQSADPKTAERYVMAFDLASGKELWRKSQASSVHPLHARSSYASSTPCANDKAVFASWGAPDGVVIKAFTHAGEELWTRNLGRYVSQHGFGGSPILYGNTLILLNSQDAQELPEGVAPGQTEVIALDVASGETVWRTPRTTTRVCYGVPALYKGSDGRDVLVMNETGDGFFGLDAKTGSPLWNRQAFTKRCVSSPLIVGNLIFGTEGSGGGGNILFAINAARAQEIAFDIRSAAPYVPTPVARGNMLFLWADNGIVTAVELPSGKTVATKRIGGNVSSSPIIVGDKLIGIAEDGTLTVLSADSELKKLGEIKLGETTRSTPAATDQHLLVRTDSKLICVSAKQAK
ncbi:MAG: PQQ-binding-like beta-propeller repeat protein [Pirellulales bacterium]